MQVRARGLREVLAVLRRLEDLDVAAAARAGAERIRADARPPVRSGRLASSLRVQVRAGSAAVVSPLVYAGVIHDGWPRHNIAPHPFLTDAASGDWLTDAADTLLEE